MGGLSGKLGTATVLRGDARALPLPDASVDLIVTSPPYWALRSYQDGGRHYAGQIGSEPTPSEYVAALIDCTREWMRVLKPTGSLFVNLGDKYSDRADGGPSSARSGRGDHAAVLPPGRSSTAVAPRKSLLMLPERYRIAAVDQLGLIARAVLVWSKPNGLPESVTDRVRRSHEDWVHLVRQPRYYAAVDEIRQPHRMRPQRRPDGRSQRYAPGQPAQTYSTSQRDEAGVDGHPLGALPGSVWEIATEPLTVPAELGVDHYAAFPTEWPRRLILGWSPPGICTACGEGRRPVVDRPGLLGGDNNPDSRNGSRRRSTMDGGRDEWARRMAAPDRITGYACACLEPTAPTQPSVVLDPLGGTGTTALVARALGRHGITVDRSADYCRLAAWRTADPGQLAKVLGVPKPPTETSGQAALFDTEVSA